MTASRSPSRTARTLGVGHGVGAIAMPALAVPPALTAPPALAASPAPAALRTPTAPLRGVHDVVSLRSVPPRGPAPVPSWTSGSAGAANDPLNHTVLPGWLRRTSMPHVSASV